MNNTTIINISNINNSNIAYMNTYHCQIMTTIAYRIVKYESRIKKAIMANHTFFAVVTFSRINPLAYINSFVMQHL